MKIGYIEEQIKPGEQIETATALEGRSFSGPEGRLQVEWNSTRRGGQDTNPMSDASTSHFRTLITTTEGRSEQRVYEWLPLGAHSSVDGLAIALWTRGLAARRDAPIILRATPGMRAVAIPAAGELVVEGSDSPSVLWAASQAIAPVAIADGFITALDLLRKLLLSEPSFMGLLLLGRNVPMPDYHTPASLAKLRIGVRQSAHNDPHALAGEARETLERASAEEQEAVNHYRNFALDLRRRLRERRQRAG